MIRTDSASITIFLLLGENASRKRDEKDKDKNAGRLKQWKHDEIIGKTRSTPQYCWTSKDPKPIKERGLNWTYLTFCSHIHFCLKESEKLRTITNQQPWLSLPNVRLADPLWYTASLGVAVVAQVVGSNPARWGAFFFVCPLQLPSLVWRVSLSR